MSGHTAAREAARGLLSKFGIQRPEDIRVEDLAWALGAEIVVGGVFGATARLTVRGALARIRISEGVDPNRARFSIAHEIGHLVLHRETLPSLGDCDFRDFRRQSSQESEANAFAAELLLPQGMIAERCRIDPSFEAVRALAEDFRTSLTAATTNFAKACPIPCAVAMAEDGRVKWTVRNPAWQHPLLHRGDRIDPESLAALALVTGRDQEKSRVRCCAWLREGVEVELFEQAVAQKEYGSALSLLWHPTREALAEPLRAEHGSGR